MVGDIEFHHPTSQLFQSLSLSPHYHALGDPSRAGGGIAVAPLHFDKAEAAGTEALDAIGRAQLWDGAAGQRRRPHDAGAFGHGDALAIDGEHNRLAGRNGRRRAVIGFAGVGHSAASLTGAGAPKSSGK